MPTPYDTGKVKIGLLYEPPRDYLMSRDADLLQSAFIRPPAAKYTDHRLLETRAAIVDTLMLLCGMGVIACLMFFPALYQLFIERFL